MKRIIYILPLLLSVVAVIRAQEVRFFDARVGQYGQLEQALGDQWNRIDSLVVYGPVDSLDFITMWKCGFEGELTVLNLEKAQVKNNRIPDRAFFKSEKQVIDDRIYYLGIRHIILPESIQEIGELAFDDLMELKQINIPKDLRKLGEYSFQNCHLLSTDPLIIPEGVTDIPVGCFARCRGLSRVILPSTLKKISVGGFYDTRISEVNFPEGLEAIGQAAFYQANIKQAILPRGLKDLGGGVFSGADSLKEIRFPEGLKIIPEGTASWCPLLEKVNIPNSVVEIGNDAFGSCYKLKGIRLPEGLKRIGWDAFWYCAIDSIVFPASLEYLGAGSCANWSEIKKIYSLSPIPPLCRYMEDEDGRQEHETFHGFTPKDTPIYVPIGSAEKYRQAFGWNYFTNFIETDKFPMGVVSPTITEGQYNVYGKDGNIVIELPDSSSIGVAYDIYSENGELIESGSLSTTLLRPMTGRGLYIVRLGNTSYKVVL